MPNCKTIAICNQKGGVGKTTTTMNLGIGLANKGKRVLLVDCDPQGDLTTCLGWQRVDEIPVTLATKMHEIIRDNETNPESGILHHNEGVDLIPSNTDLEGLEMYLVTAMSRENILKSYLNMVNYILIDCRPSLGMLTLNALTAADSVIIPVQAQYLPARAMTQLLRTVSKVKAHTNPNLAITIWTSIDLIVPCLKAKLRREFPSADENEITALMHSVNFKYFEDMKAKLDKVSIGKPIIVIASFSDPFNKDNCSNHVKVIDSGNLGECFDEDFDLAEWYIDENGDLCSYDVDREGFGNYVYFTFKEGTPLSVKQHFFTEAEKLNSQQDRKKSYSVPEIQKILKVERHTVYKLIKEGHFKAAFIGGKWRISRLSFDLWLDGKE